MIRANAEEIVRKNIARFVDTEIIPKAQEIDNKGEFPIDILKQIAEMGIFGIRYPKDKGGAGGNTTLYSLFVRSWPGA